MVKNNSIKHISRAILKWRKHHLKICEFVLIRSVIYSQKRYDKIREVTWMAKPIEIGLVLEGDDAKRFYTYMENPTITEKGRELIREAVRLAKLHPLNE
jgi:hypothetical protein